MLTIAVTLLALTLPAVIAVFVRPVEGVAIDPGKFARNRKAVVWESLFLVVLTILTQAMTLIGALSGDRPLPLGWDERFSSPLAAFAVFPWMTLFGILFYRHRGEREKVDGEPQRGASLLPRQRENPIGTGHWIVAWAIWLAFLVYIIVRFVQKESPDESMAKFTLVMGIFIQVMVVVFLCCGPIMTRQVLMHEPEPLPTSENETLRAAYGRHRRANAWMVYIAFLLLLSHFLMLGALVEEAGAPGGRATAFLCLAVLSLMLGFFMIHRYGRRRRSLDRMQAELFDRRQEEDGSGEEPSLPQ
jgi:hypothetical protein